MTLVLLAMTKDRAELRSRRNLVAARDAALSVSDAKSKFLAGLITRRVHRSMLSWVWLRCWVQTRD